MKVFELKIKAYLEAEDIKKVMDGLLLDTRSMNIVAVRISEVADTDQLEDAIETALTNLDDKYQFAGTNRKKTKPEDLN